MWTWGKAKNNIVIFYINLDNSSTHSPMKIQKLTCQIFLLHVVNHKV